MSKDSNCLAAFSILPGLDFSGAASEPVSFSAMSWALDSGSMAAILNHFQLSFESAGGAQILQDGNDVARRRSDGGERAHQFFACRALFQDQIAGLLFFGADANLRHDLAGTRTQRRGLRNGESGL